MESNLHVYGYDYEKKPYFPTELQHACYIVRLGERRVYHQIDTANFDFTGRVWLLI